MNATRTLTDPRLVPALRSGAVVVSRASFTQREIQVANLLADGLWAPEVGRRLHLAPTTVVTYAKHARAKIGVRTTPALVLGLYEHQLLPEPPASSHPLNLDADALAIIPLLLHGIPGSQIASRLNRPVGRVRADMQTLFSAVLARNATHAVRRLRGHGMRYPLSTRLGGAA